MQMKHGLAGLFAIIDYQPEIISISFIFGNPAGDQQQVSEQLLVRGGHISHPGEGFFGDHEDMHRCLGIDVPEGEAQFILVHNGCGYFPIDDLAENSFCHDFPFDKSPGK